MPDQRPKRPAPFCLRLSAKERASLERDAGDMPLATFIKLRVFSGERDADRKVAARSLATLGKTGLLDFLEALQEAQRVGQAVLPRPLEIQLPLVIAALRGLRNWLLRLLGIDAP